MPAEAEPLPSTPVAGRYDLLRLLGHGSFGHTFLAHDRETHGQVALKLFRPERGIDYWKARELLDREATVLRGLSHSGIPAIHGALSAEWNDKPASFLIMEFIEGESLADIIDRRQSLAAGDVVRLFLKLLDILEYLHGRLPPILHRDIKPANIMVRPDGSPVLVDFGSVRHVFLGENESGSTIAGTYGYMPYEQYMGQATPSSDLYALAASFLHVITGRAPREFINDQGRIAVPLTIPGEARLREVIVRLLRPSPTERFATASETRAALTSSLPILAVSTAHIAPTQLSAAALDARISRLPDAATQDRLRRLHEMLADPAPRYMDFSRYDLLDELVPHMPEYVSSVSSPGDLSTVGLFEFLVITICSLGVYPLMVYAMGRARRNQVGRLMLLGRAVRARVERIDFAESAITERIARVHFSFEISGIPLRDSGRVLLKTAQCWEPGDEIEILYDDKSKETAIVSGR